MRKVYSKNFACSVILIKTNYCRCILVACELSYSIVSFEKTESFQFLNSESIFMGLISIQIQPAHKFQISKDLILVTEKI